jgi:hypothetical protein
MKSHCPYCGSLSYSLMGGYQHFGIIYCLYIQGKYVSILLWRQYFSL